MVLDELAASVGGGTVAGSGSWVHDGGALEGRASVADVELARLPWLPGPEALRELRTTASGEVDVTGRLAAPEGRVSLRLAETRYRDQTFQELTFEAVLDGAQASLQGELGEERLLSGRLLFEEEWPLHLDLELAALPLSRAVQSLPGRGAEERFLALAGAASLDVPLRQTSGLAYETRVDSLEMNLGGGGVSAGPFTVSGSREAVAIRGLALSGGEGRLEVDGELGLASDAPSPLTVHGELALADLAAFLPDTELTGTAVADVSIAGRLSAPDVTGELRVTGEAGRVGRLALGALGLEASAREGVLTIQRASVAVAGGEISASGDVALGPRASGDQTLEFRLQGVDAGALLEARPGEPRLVAPLDMSGRLRIAARSLDAIEGDGEITGWSVGGGFREAGAGEAHRVALRRGPAHPRRPPAAGKPGASRPEGDLGPRRSRPAQPRRGDGPEPPQPAAGGRSPAVRARPRGSHRAGPSGRPDPGGRSEPSRTLVRSFASLRSSCPA